MKIGAEIILPNPRSVAVKTVEMLGEKLFYMRVIGSLGRVFVSFFIALFSAVVVALTAHLSKFFEKLFYPVIVMVRATPTMSFIFLCIIWFNSSISPVVVALAVLFPILYASVLTAIKECDADVVEMSELYGVPKSRQIVWFYLPSVASRVYSDSVSALAFNVKLIISAEALAQTGLSLGDSMKLAKETLEVAELFAYTGASVLLSYLLELLLKIVKKGVKKIVYART